MWLLVETLERDAHRVLPVMPSRPSEMLASVALIPSVRPLHTAPYRHQTYYLLALLLREVRDLLR